MVEILFSILLVVLYLSAYRISLYSLAVFLDPDEIESLYPYVSGSQRDFLSKLADDPRAFTQIATVYKSFALIAASALSVHLLESLAAAINLAVLVVWPTGLVLLWVGYILVVEYLPRRSSRTAINRRMAKRLWIIQLISVLFWPVVRVYRLAIDKIGAGEPIAEEEKEEIVERAIESLAEQAGIGESLVEEDEKEMIGQIFLLDQKVAREIMVPRVQITGIEKSMSFKEIRELVLKDGHSRYPVFDGAIDKVIGMIYVKDLFNNMPEAGEKFTITQYLRKPYFVSEDKIIGELLSEFKNGRQHIAIVMDEYGGVVGLVTLEDVIEEIVGEIRDEHDLEEEEFVSLSDGRFLVNASLRVEELQDYLDTDYEQGDYDTVGGLIYHLIGGVPSVGQKVKWHDLEFEIDKVDGRRIRFVKVEVMNSPSNLIDQ